MSNAKIIFIYSSILIIVQSSLKFGMLYARIDFNGKQHIFVSFAAVMLLRRLAMVVMSIDQIAIIKLDFQYKLIFTKKVIFWLVLSTYIVAVEFVVCRYVFRNFQESQIVTTSNVLSVDSLFIAMTFISIFHIRKWKQQRKNLSKSARSNEAFLAILAILTFQILLSIVPDVIGTTALFTEQWQAEWKSGTHFASGLSALCDPLFYILFIRKNRKTLIKILKRKTLFLRFQGSVSPQSVQSTSK